MSFFEDGEKLGVVGFGDIFDIVYADTNDEALSKYAYLIDATPNGGFAKAKGDKFRVLKSADIAKLEAEIKRLAKEVMPAYVSDLCWLVSTDENGKSFTNSCTSYCVTSPPNSRKSSLTLPYITS